MTKVVPWVPYLWQYAAHITGPDGREVGVRPVQRRHGLRARRRALDADAGLPGAGEEEHADEAVS